jgi:type IV secretory pathway VirB2 component (pilin)/type IV secretory pathway TrbD component
MTKLRHRLAATTALAGYFLFAAPAWAAGSNMPWEAPLQSILESIEGPVAKIIAVMIIIITGLTLAFGDTSGRRAQAHPDRFRPVDRVRGQLVLPELLQLRRRGARLMRLADDQVPGFTAPVHRAPCRADPARRGSARVAIANGTLAAGDRAGAAALARGLAIWLVGHLLAVWAAKRDAQFVDVVRRHLRYPPHLGV